MKKLMLSAVAVCFLAACATDPYTGESKVSKTAWGTGIGTLAGAGIGALVGGEKGALVGAGIGAVGGASVGGYMDIQARRLREESACRCKKSATTFALLCRATLLLIRIPPYSNRCLTIF